MTVGVRILLLFSVLFASCTHAPEVRPGPALEAVFSPPRGGSLVEAWKQTRVVAIDFQDGETRQVKEEVGGEVVEEYDAWHDGWRVTATVQGEAAIQNGRAVPPVLPLVGVPFTHRVSEQGQFIEPMDIDESLRTMRERVRDRRLGRLLDSMVTPNLLARRVERAWRDRYDGRCNVPMTPGDVSYSVEEQELPAGGTAKMLCRRTVVGEARTQGQATIEIALEYGGASSAFLKDPAVGAVVEEAGGVATLTENVKGTGVRFVSQSGCHVLEEASTFSGYSKLNKSVAEQSGFESLPKRIRFEVSRSVKRRALKSQKR